MSASGRKTMLNSLGRKGFFISQGPGPSLLAPERRITKPEQKKPPPGQRSRTLGPTNIGRRPGPDRLCRRCCCGLLTVKLRTRRRLSDPWPLGLPIRSTAAHPEILTDSAKKLLPLLLLVLLNSLLTSPSSLSETPDLDVFNGSSWRRRQKRQRQWIWARTTKRAAEEMVEPPKGII